MTEHPRWETALDQRRRTDPGIDDPDRRAAARDNDAAPQPIVDGAARRAGIDLAARYADGSGAVGEY
jgi:hypothetical protein